MIRTREWMVGQRDQFAIKLSIFPDPDDGKGASEADAATWGSLELWVNGLNLCQHREQEISIDSVQWYMLPVLRWLIDKWDFLLHEERLPGRNADRDSWLSMRQTMDAPAALPELQAEAWEVSWHLWWQRHSLLACREGGLFPNVFIRRFRDQIEFSWGPTTLAGAPGHYEFFASHGYARVDPQVVADVMWDLLDNATEHLCKDHQNEPAFSLLRQEFQAIESSGRNSRRLGLAAGFSENGTLASVQYDELVATLSNKQVDGRLEGFLKCESTKTIIFESPQVCLMFGTIAPNINQQDVSRLADFIANAYSPNAESHKLKNMTRDEPIFSALQRPWDHGYDLADSFHEALFEKYCQHAPVDIEGLYNELEIAIQNVTLNDRSIRGVALAGENFKPSVAINQSYRYQEPYPRRFTLAHELCHLLHDREHGKKLAIVSSPWAPVDIEKRANAFAAMFLMPTELIVSVAESQSIAFDSIPDLWRLCESLQVSFSSAIEHLCNLGFVDESTRDAMRQEMIDKQSPTAESP